MNRAVKVTAWTGGAALVIYGLPFLAFMAWYELEHFINQHTRGKH